MTNTRMRHSLLVAAVAWIAALGTVAAAETPQVLPSVKLRGYGAVAGEFSATRLPGGGGSLLQIHCEDVAKARLLHAKYLSDLGLLPGVRAGTLAGPGGPVAYRAIDRQGAIAAVRAGGDVCILTAANAGDLDGSL